MSQLHEPTPKANGTDQAEAPEKKLYTGPQILVEMELELQAGSPLDVPEPFEDLP